MEEPSKLTYMQQYYKNNKDKYKTLIGQWKQRNPTYFREYYTKHRRFVVCNVCGNKYTQSYINRHVCKL